jgi:APA family basic amino acid/polyamine antiporter
VSSTEGSPPVAHKDLFARNATGLVREVSPLNAYLMNFVVSHPVLPVATGLFFVYSTFPGGSIVVGGLLAIPLILAFTYSFGFLTSMIPRTGGDYVIVSRILHPTLGLISSFCMTMAQLMSCAFFGRLVVTEGVGPGLVGIGLIAHSHGLVTAGTTVAASKGWTFAIGTVLFIAAALILVGGWGRTLRLQNILFFVVSLGLLVCVAIALFTSPAGFVSNFNNFARPFTHNANTYGLIISSAVKTGVHINSGFTWNNTIPVIGVFATFSIFTYFSSFVGGELRQGRSSKTVNMMVLAGVTGVLSIIICAAIFIHTFGANFLDSAFAANTIPASISTSPTYFFLISASVGSVALTVFLVVTFILFWPLLTYVVFIQPTRVLFAYAFDGILPKAVTKLSRRHIPWVAVVITLLATEAIFGWSLTNSSIFTIIIYATLIQLIAMGLVGVSAIAVRWRRPELYNASTTQHSILGIPAVAIAGIGAVAGAVFIWVLYFTNGGFGLTGHITNLWWWVLGLVVGALLFYFGARIVRARHGVDLDLVYAEIPPE